MMTKEYNLTWEEAKLAMERGAICEKLSHYGPLIYRYNLKLQLLANCTWKDCVVINGDETREGEWRIVELTDCDIVQRTEIKFSATCLTHFERALHQETETECLDILKLNCIAKFTEILKSDIIKIRKEEYQKTGRDILKEIYCSQSEELSMKKQMRLQPGKCYKFENGGIKETGLRMTMYTEELPSLTKSQIHILEKMQHHKMNHDLDSERYIMGQVREENIMDKEFLEVDEVSFEVAISQMRMGKFFKSIEGEVIYTFIENELNYFKDEDGKFLPTYGLNVRVLHDRFIEVEDPEKKELSKLYNEMGFKISNSDEPIFSKEPTISIEATNFDIHDYYILKDSEKERSWSAALNTFMRLKSHPLAEKFSVDVQFFIMNSSNGINVGNWGGHLKTSFLSPPFHDLQSAKQAIADIGEENLKHMFYTFAGMYDKI